MPGPPVSLSLGPRRNSDVEGLFGDRGPEVDQSGGTADMLEAAVSTGLEAHDSSAAAAAPAPEKKDKKPRSKGKPRSRKSKEHDDEDVRIDDFSDDEESVDPEAYGTDSSDGGDAAGINEDAGGKIEPSEMKDLLVRALKIPVQRASQLAELSTKTGELKQVTTIGKGHPTFGDFLLELERRQNEYARANGGKPCVLKGPLIDQKRLHFQENMNKFVPWLQSLVKESSSTNRPQRSSVASQSPAKKNRRKRKAGEMMNIDDDDDDSEEPVSKNARTRKTKARKREPKESDSDDDDREEPVSKKACAGDYDLNAALAEAKKLVDAICFDISTATPLEADDLANYLQDRVIAQDFQNFTRVLICKIPDQPGVEVEYRFVSYDALDRFVSRSQAFVKHIQGDDEPLRQLRLDEEILSGFMLHSMVFHPSKKYPIPELKKVAPLNFGKMCS